MRCGLVLLVQAEQSNSFHDVRLALDNVRGRRSVCIRLSSAEEESNMAA